jgi:uncharacterized protein (DUF697 family)
VPGPLKLANLWRVVRDVDLSALRAATRSPFVLSVVSETGEDAARLRALLSAGLPAPHPWIETAAATPEALSVLSTTPIAGLLASRAAHLSPSLDLARQRFVALGRPVITIVVGDTSPGAGIAASSEHARVVVTGLDAEGIEKLAVPLVDVVGEDAQLALASQLPALRRAVFARIIERSSRANASFALTTGLAETIPILTAPLNLGDIVILTKNQLMMCYRIALAAGREGEPRALMGEILGVLGGGVLFRTAARELVGLIPVIGLIPKVAIAYAGTQAIGRAMVAWTTEGRQITTDVIARYSRESMAKGRAMAERLTSEQVPGARRSRLDRWTQFLPLPRRRLKQN